MSRLISSSTAPLFSDEVEKDTSPAPHLCRREKAEREGKHALIIERSCLHCSSSFLLPWRTAPPLSSSFHFSLLRRLFHILSVLAPSSPYTRRCGRCLHLILHKVLPFPFSTLYLAVSFATLLFSDSLSNCTVCRITRETIGSEFDPLGLNKETASGFGSAMESIIDFFFPALESTSSPRKEKSSLNRGAAGKDLISLWYGSHGQV